MAVSEIGPIYANMTNVTYFAKNATFAQFEILGIIFNRDRSGSTLLANRLYASKKPYGAARNVRAICNAKTFMRRKL